MEDADIRVSRDGRGRCFDNIFVERLWRSVKYEEIYLHEYPTVAALERGLQAYFLFYNHERPLFSRLWVCTEREKFVTAIRGRLRYALTPMALIDLAAILPLYLPLFFTVDLRLLRLLQLLRLLKVIRYSESLRIFTDVYRMKKGELTMVFLVILFLLVMASALIFYVEPDAQTEAFSSIPASMWWGVATLTTVGYGDIYPITPLGRFLGAIIALLGIGLFALPAGILGSGFVGALRRKESSKFYCPHCSEEITRK